MGPIRSVHWHAYNGDTIKFDRQRPYLMGWFNPGVPSGAAQVTRGVQQDGQDTHHITRDPLTPVLSDAAIIARDQKEFDALRRRLQSALDPKYFGVLIYNTEDGSYRLSCRPVAGASIGSRIGCSAYFNVDWISDSANWVKAKPDTLFVGIIKPKWRFPWVIRPTVFGTFRNTGTIMNPTVIDILPRIVISETEASCVVIGNRTTGESTVITRPIGTGDKIEIDMAVPSIRLMHGDGTEEDVTHWTTLDSVFPWACVPGHNEIYSTSETPNQSPVIKVIWHQPEGGL